MPATFHWMHIMAKNKTVQVPYEILLINFSLFLNSWLFIVIFQHIKFHRCFQPSIPSIFLQKSSSDQTKKLMNNIITSHIFLTIRASIFEGFDSRRSIISPMIFILAVASIQPDKNLKMRHKIWGRKNWELYLLLLWLSDWLCFCKTCRRTLKC